MADPLAAYADREVPEPTNFFDPAGARDIIARYGSARRRSESSEALAEAESNALNRKSQTQRLQDDKVQSAQRDTLFGQHEEEYQSQKAAMATRGDFLRSLANKETLDPDSPDYPQQKASLLAGMHEGLGKDDAVRDTLISMDHQYESGQRVSAAEQARKQALEDRKAYLHEKLASDPRIVGVLTPEEYQTYVDPETGEVDTVGASQHAYSKSRENKMGDTKEIIAERARVSSEAQTKKSAEIDRRKIALKSGVADQDAFPNQEAAFLLKHPKFDPTTAGTTPKKVQELANYNSAKAYEKNKIESEIASALNYSNPEDYVKLAGSTPPAKKKRRDLWDLAHEMAGGEGSSPAAAPTGGGVSKEKGAESLPPAKFQKTKKIGDMTYGFDGTGWRPVGG